MHKPNRIKYLAQNRFDHRRLELFAIFFDDLQKIPAFDEVQCHIRGVVFLENLMHANDVRVIKLGEVTCFLHKQPNDRRKLVLMRPAAGCHQCGRASTESAGKAFFDHDTAVQTVPRTIRDPKPTGIQKVFNFVLAVH